MTNVLKDKLNGHITRRILIAIFCLIIGTIVAVVIFNFYVPNQNALGALASVCMDIICIIILIILIASFAFGKYEGKRTTRLFALLLVATIWAVFLDFLNWAFDGSLEFGHLTYYFTLGSLCMGAILAGIFVLYLYSFMCENHGLYKMRKVTIICAIMNVVSFLLTFILAITGTAFVFVDGHYEIGALYDLVTAIPVLSLLIMTGMTFYYVKEVGLHDALAAAGYILFMIAGALLESEYRIGSTYAAVSIADIFIFVMLQNEIIAREKQKVQKWMKQSNTDELTGLYNRHAYENDISMMEKGTLKETFVYVSVDVNSLKMVNDNHGHYAGDELLVGAADCLKKCFGPYGKLYRIGGDEFIALIYADENTLEKLKNSIKDACEKWHGNLTESLTLSCGYATKAEDAIESIRQMAILADDRMYEAKKEYYRKTGIDRRKK